MQLLIIFNKALVRPLVGMSKGTKACSYLLLLNRTNAALPTAAKQSLHTLLQTLEWNVLIRSQRTYCEKWCILWSFL